MKLFFLKRIFSKKVPKVSSKWIFDNVDEGVKLLKSGHHTEAIKLLARDSKIVKKINLPNKKEALLKNLQKNIDIHQRIGTQRAMTRNIILDELLSSKKSSIQALVKNKKALTPDEIIDFIKNSKRVNSKMGPVFSFLQTSVKSLKYVGVTGLYAAVGLYTYKKAEEHQQNFSGCFSIPIHNYSDNAEKIEGKCKISEFSCKNPQLFQQVACKGITILPGQDCIGKVGVTCAGCDCKESIAKGYTCPNDKKLKCFSPSLLTSLNNVLGNLFDEAENHVKSSFNAINVLFKLMGILALLLSTCYMFTLATRQH